MIDRDSGTFVQSTDEEALERKYVEGYRRKPESPSVGKLGEEMAREVWQEETWDERS
jgi:hypothetical protein